LGNVVQNKKGDSEHKLGGKYERGTTYEKRKGE